MAHGDGVTASSTSSLNVTDQGQSESEQFRCCAQTTGLYSLGWCCLGFICLVVGFSSSAYYMTHHSNVSSVFDGPGRFCQTPTLRREWRSLPAAEKRDYIRAVRCLKTVPSQLYLNHSLYDDFPWIHINYGKYSHDAAPFLAWHRYFIHTYEQKLQEQCGYKGHLTYWDWTLDWENIASSPVWNVETGFGGNGNFSVGHPVLKAHCVTEGPFAGLEVLYFENIYQPHCLLRGFDKPPKSFRRELQPKALLKLLLSPDYDSINLGLEHGPHNAIPRSINGDFSLQMAPFDPVFFLHHTQLDRMWWRWQQEDVTQRTIEYTGKASSDSISKASLTDILPMGGLASDIKVSDIMRTDSGLLCYRY